MAGDPVKRLIVAVRRVAAEDPSVLAMAYLAFVIAWVLPLSLLALRAHWIFYVAGGVSPLIMAALLIAPAVGATRRRMAAGDASEPDRTKS